MKNILYRQLCLLFFMLTVCSSSSVYAQTKRYVKTAASGTGTGASWANASSDLQAMITASAVGDEVWVAAGTYYPNAYPTGCVGCSTTQDYAFLLKSGVKVYGGFAGTETTIAQRTATNTSILSGDIGTAGTTTDNVYHVVISVGDANTTVLDGFTISDGFNVNASYTVESQSISHLYGNGVHFINSSTVVNRCIFKKHIGYYGGAAFFKNSPSKVNNCLFYNNSSFRGGAIYNSSASPVLVNCTIANNNASNDGGGIFNSSTTSAPSITNCIIYGNTGSGTKTISGGTPTVGYSNIEGGFAGTGNINDIPYFKSAATGDFTLEQCSASINSGTNTAVSAILTDLANSTRTQQVNVDMGVYESNYTTGPCTFTWTGATSTTWTTNTNWTPNGVPNSTDNIVIPQTPNQPELPSNQTISNLSLTGSNKIVLGNSNLTVNTLTGGSSSSYVVTNGTGALTIKSLPTTTTTTFHVGASTTSYDPVTIKPTISADFSVAVKTVTDRYGFSGNIADLVKLVLREWAVKPLTNAGSTVLSFKNGGTTYTPTKPKVGHYKSTNAWEELPATHSSGTWTTTTTSFSPFGVGDEGGFVELVLPVEIVSFEGKYTEGGNLLTWTTANEQNNRGFQVERIMDNGQWTILGFKTANNKASSYDFTDNTPLNMSYYRLRQLDNDGKVTYSKVVSVSNQKSSKLITYPNPVSNVLTVETDNKDVFQIFNFLGQQVLNGKAAQRIDVSALPQGTYFLKVDMEQVQFIKY